MNITIRFSKIFEPELIRELEQKSKNVFIKAGETILDIGQAIRTMPIILKGSVKVSRTDENGKELFYNKYAYKEGIYKIDEEAFWANCTYYLEDFLDNDLNMTQVLEELHFLSSNDKIKIEEMYNEL